MPIPKKNAGPVISSGMLIYVLIPKIIPVTTDIQIIITINILYNLILSERLEKIDRILLLNNDQYREKIKDKIRKELQDGLEKENMISVEDKKLLYKIYLKLKDEFKSIEKSQ